MWPACGLHVAACVPIGLGHFEGGYDSEHIFLTSG